MLKIVNDDMELLGKRISSEDVKRIRCVQISLYCVLGLLIGIIVYGVTIKIY